MDGEFKIYYTPNINSIPVYLDGSESEGYSFYTAIDRANENASSMPNRYIYVQNAVSMKIVYSVINRFGILEKQDRR